MAELNWSSWWNGNRDRSAGPTGGVSGAGWGSFLVEVDLTLSCSFSCYGDSCSSRSCAQLGELSLDTDPSALFIPDPSSPLLTWLLLFCLLACLLAVCAEVGKGEIWSMSRIYFFFFFLVNLLSRPSFSHLFVQPWLNILPCDLPWLLRAWLHPEMLVPWMLWGN